MNTALQKEVGAELWVKIAWALLSALWNVAGVTLLTWGQPALGPTASLGGALILIGVAAAFWQDAWFARNEPQRLARLREKWQLSVSRRATEAGTSRSPARRRRRPAVPAARPA